MTITYGVVNNSATAATGATSFTTASTTTQSGDTFLIFAPADYPLTGVSDNKGNTYTLLAQSPSGLHRVYIASGATTGGAGHTFSSAYSSTSWASLFGLWIRGAGSYDAGSINTFNRGGAGPWWTGDVTLANANNLLLSFVGMFAGSATSTFSWNTFGTGPAPSVAGQLSDSSAYSPGGILASQGTFGLTGTKYSIDITLSSSSSGADIITVAFPDAGGGGGTSVAATGVAGTGATGNVGVTHTNALTGNAGTGAAGTVKASLSVQITGNSATSAVGTVAPALSVSLTGVQATGSAGTVVPSITVAITGVQATGAAGTVSTTSGQQVAISGVQGAGAAGNVTPSISVGITGVQATGAAGNVAPGTPDKSVAISGVQAQGQAGNVAFASRDVTVGISGVWGVGLAGNVGTSGGDAPVVGGFPGFEVDQRRPRAPRMLQERRIQPILERMLAKKLPKVKPAGERAAKRAKRIEQETARMLVDGATDAAVLGMLDEWKAQAPYVPPRLAEIPTLDLFLAQVAFRIEQQAQNDRIAAAATRRRQDEDSLLALLLA